MNEKEWIDRLRQQEQDYDEPVPEGLWDDIERELTPMLSHKRPKTMFLWLRLGRIAAAVVLLCGLGSLFLLFREESQSIILLADSETKKKVENYDIENESIFSESPISNVSGQSYNIVVSSKNTSFNKAIDVLTEAKNNGSGHIPTIGKDSVPVLTSSEKQKNRAFERKNKTEQGNEYLARKLPNLALSNNHKTISFTAYAGNQLINSNTFQSGYSPITESFIPNDGDLSDVVVGENPVSDILWLNQGENVKTKTTHRLPIRFGINVSIPVYERLCIETGLAYSILSSDTESGTRSNKFDTEQTLHYIGIPLKATYDIWNSHSFGLYATGGGMVEKCVYGCSVTDFVIGNDVVSSKTEKKRERQLQFSLTAGAGVKWNVTKFIDLFVEPGVSYYIDNHSEIINSYKDRPFNFDLKVGLRFNITNNISRK